MKKTIFLTLIMSMATSFMSLAQEGGPQEAEDKKPLKVAFVTDSFDPKSGGMVTARRFVDALRKKGMDITVITAKPQKGDEGVVQVDGYFPPFGRNVMEKNGMIFGKASSKELKKLFQDKDLVYVHLPFGLESKSIKVAKKMGKPVIAGFHVQPENIFSNLGINSKVLSYLYYRSIISSFYNKADTVICPSEFAQNILNGFGSFRAVTEVISNGIQGQFRPEQVEKLPEHKDKFVILVVGRLSKEKQQEVVIDAVKKSKHKDKIQLILACKVALQDEYKDRGSSLPNPPEVGFVSDEKLMQLLKSSDLFVSASAVELEGMSVLEAMGTGLPAIISDASTSAAGYFAINDFYRFTDRDSDELAGKFDHLIENPEELAEARKQYIEKAENYRFERSVEKMEKLFHKVVAEKEAKRDSKKSKKSKKGSKESEQKESEHEG